MIEAESVEAPNRGPYPFNQPKQNTVLFTPAQVGDTRIGCDKGEFGPDRLSFGLFRIRFVA